MLFVLRDAWALMLGMMMIMTAHGLTTTLVGVRGSLLGFSELELGLVMAGHYVGFGLGAAFAPRLIGRVGHVRVFAAFASAASATLILFPFFAEPALWMLLRLLNGACLAGAFVVAEAWLNAACTQRNRGQVLGASLFVQLAGMVLGQVAVSFGDPEGYGHFAFATVIVSLAIGPLLLSASPVPVHAGIRPMTMRELMTLSPLGVVGMLFVGVMFGVTSTMLAVHGAGIGLAVVNIAVLVSAVTVGGALFLYPAGWLSDRVGRREVLVGLSALGALAGAAASWAGRDIWLLMLSVGLIGGAVSPMYSVVAAHANDRMEPERMAACSARLIFLNGVGASVGPPAAGALMSWAGVWAYFPLIALMFGGFAVFAGWRMRRTAPESDTDTVGFAPLPPRGTVITAGMYADAIGE